MKRMKAWRMKCDEQYHRRMMSDDGNEWMMRTTAELGGMKNDQNVALIVDGTSPSSSFAFYDHSLPCYVSRPCASVQPANPRQIIHSSHDSKIWRN